MAKQVIGLAPWEPTDESLELIESVQAVLEDYADYLPLTARQIFYRLVGAYSYSKTERAYARLLEKLNRARRAGMIAFDSIRDDGVTVSMVTAWDSPEQWIRGIVRGARGYRRDRQEGQDHYLECWVEAAGMVPQVRNVADRFGVPVYSSGGFNSTTMKWRAAQRAVRENELSGRPTKVLHIGDHDPSGVAIFENLKADVPRLAADHLVDATGFELSLWRRIAVTPQQIAYYDLEEAPAKSSDSRSVTWEGGTVQVESMTPEELATEIEEAVEEEVDPALLEEVTAREAAERGRLIEQLEGMTS